MIKKNTRANRWKSRVGRSTRGTKAGRQLDPISLGLVLIFCTTFRPRLFALQHKRWQWARDKIFDGPTEVMFYYDVIWLKFKTVKWFELLLKPEKILVLFWEVTQLGTVGHYECMMRCV